MVAGQCLDEHGDVAAVGFEVAEAELVHNRAGLSDGLSRGVETAPEPFEASDPDEAVRLDLPV